MQGVVLVEGISDRKAVEALARRRGRDLAAEGVSVIAISSEMEEVLGISDRIAVMHEGRITGVLEREQFTEEAVMRLATGAGSKSEISDLKSEI